MLRTAESISYPCPGNALGGVMLRGVLAVLLLGVVSCAGAPSRSDYVLARTARQAAVVSGARVAAPRLWLEGEKLYTKAEVAFNHRQYKVARAFFKQARFRFEAAENHSRLKKVKEGGI